ncbi:MAG: T9SS type A sorting domain-containing protein, partial [Calditrichaeota bacterium]|nr:T9SS type A sorting domain-containing protein [Calditrichota bacterium]
DVRRIIQNDYFNVADPISHLIIIGSDNPAENAVFFPAYRNEPYTNDHYYGIMRGNLADTMRYVPEISVGRYYAASVGDLQGAIKRSILYEREPFLDNQNNRAWFNHALFTCESINVPGGQFVPSMIHLMRWSWLRWTQMGMRVDTLAFSDSASSARVNQQVADLLVNQGLSVVASRGWLTGSVDRNQRAVNTGRRNPFVMAITCLSWDLQKFFFIGSSHNNPKGPVASISVHGLTNTKFNNSVLGGMVRGMRDNRLHQPGWLSIMGKWQGWNDYRYAPNIYEDLFRVIVVTTTLGDPSTRIYTARPFDLQVDHPERVTPGTTGIVVRVMAEGAAATGAVVSLTQANGISFIQRPGADGFARFAIQPGALSQAPVRVTITGQNLVPYHGAIEVSHSAVSIDLEGVEYENQDGLFANGERVRTRLQLHNSGNQNASNVVVHLASDYAPVTFSQQSLNIGVLNAGATATPEVELIVGRNAREGEVAGLRLRIVAEQGEWSHAFDVATSAGIPSLTGINLQGGDLIDRGHTARFQTVLRNSGTVALPAASLQLVSLNPEQVTVVDATARLAALAPNTQATSDADFRVSLSEYAVPGSIVRFQLLLASREQNDNWRDTVTFERTVGQAGIEHPIGPDAYGYYCFDSFDQSWDKRPTFHWREINFQLPDAEFRGTKLPMDDFAVDKDTSNTIRLPFTFRYYGVDYDTLVVCTNGWVAFGAWNSFFIDFRNNRIPGIQGPDAMLAINWDDLISNRVEDAGVYVHYIEDEGIFIIEWSRMQANGDQNQVRQESQIILFDPERFPTRSGDGEFKFQYKTWSTVLGDVTDNYYATIGIKNNDGTDGIEYAYWNRYHPNARPLEDEMALLFTTDVQAITGSLAGRVVVAEDTARALQGVQVVTGGQRAVTDATGRFAFPTLPIGIHALTVSLEHYSDQRVAFTIEDGRETNLRILMTHPEVSVPERAVTTSLSAGDEGSYQWLTVVNDGNGPARFRLRRRDAEGNSPPLTLQMSSNLSREAGDENLAGIEMIGDKFYVAGSGDLFNAGDNFIHVFNRDGSESIASFSQRGVDGFGFRDLAFDPDSMVIFGGDLDTVAWLIGLDTLGNLRGRWLLPHFNVIPNSPQNVFGLAWNPDHRSIYVADEAQGKDIVEVRLEGDTLREIHRFRFNTTALGVQLQVRGLAWNPCDEDGYNLWAMCQATAGVAGNPRSLLVRANPSNGDIRMHGRLGREGLVSEYGRGLAIGFDREVGAATLAYIGDNGASDTLRLIDAGIDGRFVRFDHNWQSIPAQSQVAFRLHFVSKFLRNETAYTGGLLVEHNGAQEEPLVIATLRVEPSSEGSSEIVPLTFHLGEAFPNPFNGLTTIAFVLPKSSSARLAVYDLSGREVAVLHEGRTTAGMRRVAFDASHLASGIYLYRLEAAGQSMTRRLVLLK